ncbi:MAG: aminotransferase class I/II-fold pyridoxal phosphate-dependent enzyme [Bacteroidetes bacterium]|nr:aminotransferase class I/II-fold pyridoxal phosphate-dependent enzyme [Bacteroidota bacterium]
MTIDFTTDSINLSPKEYSELLFKLTEKGELKADTYSLHGCVEELENKFATLLGKEQAIFMPSGTLANQLAIRSLAKGNSRVIVQNESHVYNDTGDASQVLSNLNLLPLGTDKTTFTLDEVNEVIKKTASGRVSEKVGVISIESPMRRKSGELFDQEQLKQISQFAKSNDIKMHLDGARIFLASAYTGIKPSEYAALFDTVYVSLYKYFNAASGAILAGPKELIAPMFHARRMFGSGLPQVWPFAAVALNYADNFLDRFAKAVKISEELILKLAANNNFQIDRITNGTNIFKLQVKNIPAITFAENLKKNGVVVRPPTTGSNELTLSVNETLNRSTASELENIFVKSLGN